MVRDKKICPDFVFRSVKETIGWFNNILYLVSPTGHKSDRINRNNVEGRRRGKIAKDIQQLLLFGKLSTA
jgi:hypothetical protein